MSCQEMVCKYNIRNRSDFRKWALKNHPDKGGNEEIFKSLTQCISDGHYCSLMEHMTDKEVNKLFKTTNDTEFLEKIITDLPPPPPAPEVKGSIKKNSCKDPNKIRHPRTGKCRNPRSLLSDIKEEKKHLKTPCKENSIRNAKTGRCRKPKVPTEYGPKAPKPCKDNQERNPETGKCRKLKEYGPKTPQRCKKNQIRNPETGRCIKPKIPKAPPAPPVAIINGKPVYRHSEFLKSLK